MRRIYFIIRFLMLLLCAICIIHIFMLTTGARRDTSMIDSVLLSATFLLVNIVLFLIPEYSRDEYGIPWGMGVPDALYIIRDENGPGERMRQRRQYLSLYLNVNRGTTQTHTQSYRIIQNHTQSYRIIQNHTESYTNIHILDTPVYIMSLMSKL